MTKTGFGLTALSMMTSLLLLGCGEDDDPKETVDGGNAIDAGNTANCATTPTRLVVLGDSITACFGVGGKDSATCGPNIFQQSLAAGHAPGIVYDNQAVSGAVVTDIPDLQLANVTTGAGHVMVLAFAGGNDLTGFLSPGVSDSDAETQLAAKQVDIAADWETVIAFFNNTTNFPDGATIIMNTQYNPFDDCIATTSFGFGISARKNELLVEYNTFLGGIADGHDNVFITDQYTSYLGHGHSFDNATCPHYQAGLAGWMEDLIHPNIAGHANLAAEWQMTADSLFAGCN